MYGFIGGQADGDIYVGKGGKHASDGTTWAKRKLTLNGAGIYLVKAGDTVM